MNYSIFSILFLLAWLIRFVERVLFHVYKWQLKEYRWDRYRDYLNSRQGVWQLLNPWYWLGILFVYYIIFWGDWSDRTMLVLGLMQTYITFSGLFSLYVIKTKGLLRPALTGRAILIATFSLAIGLPILMTEFFYFEGIITYLPSIISIIFTPIGSLFIAPLFVALLVFLTSFPANYFKRRTIEKAKAKMELYCRTSTASQKHGKSEHPAPDGQEHITSMNEHLGAVVATLPNLKVIGITGSFGKSSTKEFLATILAAKYKICKTPANQNTEIGVAKTVIYNLKSDDEIFVVEMGAYRKGEIKAICDIVKPTIGVVTAVNAQHLALFGSLETIQQTKYELIESLPEHGLAVFNLDNTATRAMAERTLKPMKTYSVERPSDVRASAITVQPEKLSFSVSAGDEKQHIVASLLGAYHVSNLLAAITVAHALGMSLAEIAEAIKTIAPSDHTMKPFAHTSGALVIDDSYSANPDGVLAALDHLKLIPRKYKVLVMMPMIELGRAGKDAHRRVGERIGEVCDIAIITQKNYFSTLQSAALQKGMRKEQIIYLAEPQAILHALQPYLNENSVILLENRIPQKVVSELCV